jgi:hypothetical protein
VSLKSGRDEKMKKVLLVVSLAVVLTLALVSTGCASSGGFTAMLARVPSDTAYLEYVNVKALRNDADLEDLYDAWKGSISSKLEAHGVAPGAVSVCASNAAGSKRFTILMGNFDLDETREELEDLHYKDDEYRDVEVWVKETGWGYEVENEVALMGNIIIIGDEAGVEACIKVIRGDASWLSKIDINDLAGRLPGGLWVEMVKDPAVAGTKGMKAYGRSARKLDSETLRVAGWAKFGDDDDADDSEDAVEFWMELQFDDAVVNQEASYLKASAELDIDDAAPLFR